MKRVFDELGAGMDIIEVERKVYDKMKERIKELEALLNKCDEAITAELSKEPMPFIVWQCQQEIKQMLNKQEKS